MNHYLSGLDAEIILALQNLGGWFLPLMRTFTVIGSGPGTMAIAALIIWSGNYRLGLRTGLLFSLTYCINSLLKLSLRRPRPFWVDSRIQALATPTEFGMPSGHAQSSVTFWGYLSYRTRKTPLLLVSIGMILFIGLSRIYLGVHSPTQVIAGWLAGALVLVLAIPLEAPVAKFVKKLSFTQLFFLLLTVSLLFLTAGIVIINIGTPFQIPELWQKNSNVFTPTPLSPLIVDTVVVSAATFLGLGLGGSYCARRKLSAGRKPRSLKVVLLRCLTGALGAGIILAAFYFPVKVSSNSIFVSEALSYLEFTLVGFWISGFSFSVFKKIGLMKE